jgi:NDP-sugar pyrophosphorylase family protein
MAKPELLVLAAGMGSRYGGLKQVDPVGPNGETIIDYSVFDAIRAGFGRLVFVIRRDIERSFKETVGRRFEERMEVDYVFQELSTVPAGYSVPATRKKPWGTGHAILVGAEAIRESFAVINGDDFYGMNSFRILAQYLTARETGYAMVGYQLKNTLSDFGTVSRGVCTTNGNDYLESVTELTKIERHGTGARYTDSNGARHPLSGDETVSLNMWGFPPSVFGHLRRQFEGFVSSRGRDDSAEFYIPTAVSELISSGLERVKVLRTPDAWFGITYREDRDRVVASIRRLIERGDYPVKLWS